MIPADDSTQRLDADSPASELQCTMPQEQDCTLPFDNETEIVPGNTCLYGETQALEEDPEEFYGTWVDTLVLDCSDEEEDTERTEVLSGDGEVLDDCATSCGDKEGKECGGGTEIGPRASLRAGGLSAVREKALKSNTVENPSLSMSLYSNKEDVCIREGSFKVTGKDNGFTGEKEGELHLKIDESWMFNKEKYEKRMEQNVGCRTARKLFNEMDADKTQLVNEAIDNVPKDDAFDYPAAGLSYIYSQEPGELSQAKALDVIDKLLALNDLGLSQDACFGKTGEVEALPVSSSKAAQSLAKTSHKNVIEKEVVFDWDDALEDESGGDFFNRIKCSIFVDGKHMKKPRSQPSKSSLLCPGRIAGTIEKVGRNANTRHESLSKIKSFSLIDSRTKTHNLTQSYLLRTSKTTTMENLFEERTHQLDAKQHFVKADVSMSMGGTCTAGPDTQMAAEAMEALCCGSPAELVSCNACPAMGYLEGSGESTKIKDSLGHGSLQKKVSSISDSACDSRRKSKRLKANTELSSGSLILSTKELKNHQISENLLEGSVATECTSTMTKPVNEKSKSKHKLSVLKSTKGGKLLNDTSLSRRRKKAVIKDGKVSSTVKTRSAEPVGQTDIRMIHREGADHSLSKEVLQLGCHSAPVAHRTRQSRAAKISGNMDALSNNHAERAEDANITQIRECRLHKQLQVTITNQPDAQGGDGLIQGICKEDSSIGMVTSCHPKRRRTCLDLNNMTPSVQHTQSKATAKSGFMLQGNVNRGKRTAIRHMPSEAHGIMPSCIKRSVPSTRSSFDPQMNASSSKQKNANNFKGQILTEHIDKIHEEIPPEESTFCAKDEGHLELEVSRKEKIQPSDSPVSSSLNEKNPVFLSPVCTGTNLLKVPQRRRFISRSSVAKELHRLESAGVPLTLELKDMRRRKDMASVRVLFSRHLGDDTVKQQKKILTRLRVPIASFMLDATHFIADKFMRTRNMLEAMATGKPVVTHLWLESCGQVGCYIDEKDYILRDAKKEKEIGFSMMVSLAHAIQKPLLQDKRVFITQNVKPDRKTISSLVKASGGLPLERIVRSMTKDEKVPEDLLVISCEEDYRTCIPLLEKGSEVFNSELILNGIVIQKLEYERHRLFSDHVRRTRSTLWLRMEDSDQFLPVMKCK